MFHTRHRRVEGGAGRSWSTCSRGRRHALLDVQWLTPHLASLGAVDLARSDYLDLLRTAVTAPGDPFG